MNAVRKVWFLPVPAVFYVFTTAPGLAHADQAIIISAMLNGHIGSAAKFHNITFLTGYLFAHLLPFGDLAYRCNLVSAFFGALTIVLFYFLALRLTKSVLLAVFSAVFLMISHSMWWHSTIAEVYAVNALFCVAILYCLVLFQETNRNKWLYLSAMLVGLSIFNHVQMGMWVPALGVVLLRPRRDKDGTWVSLVLKTGLWFLIGLLPYLAVFIKDAFSAGNIGSATYGAMGSDFVRIFFTLGSASELFDVIVTNIRLFVLQWGWPSIFYVYIVLGLYWILTTRELSTVNLAAGTAFFVNTLFFAFYPTWDKFAFLLPSFIILNYVGTLGLRTVWTEFVRNRKALMACFLLVNVFSCLYPIYFFEKLPTIATHSHFWRFYQAHAQKRNTLEDAEFLANPNKRNYTTTDDFANALFDVLPTNSIFIDHISRTYYQLTLYYQQIYDKRPDMQILLFMPVNPVTKPSDWPGAYGKDELVDTIRRAPSVDRVFLPAFYGYDEVTKGLLDNGMTLVDRPLNEDWTVLQVKKAAELDVRDLLDDVVVGIDLDKESPTQTRDGSFRPEDSRRMGTLIRFKENNPPMVIRVDWENLTRETKFASRPMYIPYNCNPLHVPYSVLVNATAGDMAEGLSNGSWVAHLYMFDTLALSASFQIE